MVNPNTDNSTILSKLQINHIVYDELSFKRTGFQQQKEDQNIKFNVQFDVKKVDAGKYRVSLGFIANSEQEYTVEVKMSAFCTIDEDFELKDEILQKNVIAILFPYIRSELTLLTSQPEMTPIVLPALNINALVDEATSKRSMQ